MLTESFIAATLSTNKTAAHASAALKDVGIFCYEFQPQNQFQYGYKKTSSHPGCTAISESHVFAAQAEKAVINVYSRARGNQEATVPFPERIRCIAYGDRAAVLVLGTEEGKLILWEVATGRLTTSAAAHLQSVSSLCITPHNDYIISGSTDTSIHVWSLPKLVSFTLPADDYGRDEPSNAPLRTFSAHRTTIGAIACGHSTTNTNFAVSASADGTCYLWHIETCRVLKTVLLPTNAISMTVDPADRAIYFGGQDGHIYSWDILQHYKSNPSNSETSSPSTTQITSKERWTAPASNPGPTNSLTLSYDGMFLISGHTSGGLMRWDVAKHRISAEVTSLGQPVTYVKMLKPEGLLSSKATSLTIPNVVKPNLEYASQAENGTSGIPANYNLHASIGPKVSFTPGDEIEQALSGPGFPQGLIDNALRALITGSTSKISTGSDANAKIKTEDLTAEVIALKQQLAALNELENKRKARRMTRIERREEISSRKREAYFEAKKKGKDGDAAMKQWEDKEAAIDQESDEEHLADKVVTD